MKYKVGDLVKIKTWEKMVREYGINANGSINRRMCFTKEMEKTLKKNDGIIKILEVHNYYYLAENFFYRWSDDMIKGLAKPEISEPITSRFEILDIRE